MHTYKHTHMKQQVELRDENQTRVAVKPGNLILRSSPSRSRRQSTEGRRSGSTERLHSQERFLNERVDQTSARRQSGSRERVHSQERQFLRSFGTEHNPAAGVAQLPIDSFAPSGHRPSSRTQDGERDRASAVGDLRLNRGASSEHLGYVCRDIRVYIYIQTHIHVYVHAMCVCVFVYDD